MQTLSSAEKLKETMKERMKGNSIDSAEQPFVVLKEIKHNLVMCSGSAVLSVLCTSPESTFTPYGGEGRRVFPECFACMEVEKAKEFINLKNFLGVS